MQKSPSITLIVIKSDFLFLEKTILSVSD